MQYHGGAMACGGARAPGQIFAAMSTEMFQGGKRCGATVTGADTALDLDTHPFFSLTTYISLLDLFQSKIDIITEQ